MDKKDQKAVMRAIASQKKGLPLEVKIEKVEDVKKRKKLKKAEKVRKARADKVTKEVLQRINKKHGTDFKLKKD